MNFDNIINEVINSKEVKLGKKIEAEHKPTIKKIRASVKNNKVNMSDADIAEEIAKNHISEFPRYYTKGLKPMEKKLQKEMVDDLFEPQDMTNIYNQLFKDQDYWASKSNIFKRILNSEIKKDPKERYISTNSPKSKTRNALIIRSVYNTDEEWEQDLITNPFYNIELKEMVAADVGIGSTGSVVGAHGIAPQDNTTYAPGDSRVPKSLFGNCKCGKKKKCNGKCKCKPQVMRRTFPGM